MFNDIPNGLPKLDKDYWKQQKLNDNTDQIDINTKFTLEKDLSNISIFGKEK